MALPDPPPGIPRIDKILSPTSKHFVIVVKLDARIAAKFPDEPWGTPITAIGIPPKDLKEWMLDYTLTEVSKPYRDASETLNWFFQKLPGPIWTTTSNSRENVIPPRFRRFITQIRTKQEVSTLDENGDPTQPDNITGDLMSSVIEDQDDTGKSWLVNTRETIDPEVAPLLGQKAYEERQKVDTFEALVTEGTPVPHSLHTVSASVTPLGYGLAVLDATTVDEWKEMIASTWDEELQCQVLRKEKFVDPPTDFTGEFTSFQIVNEDRSMMVVEVPPDEALDAFYHVFPTSEPVQLPAVLNSIGVLVSRNVSNGNSVGTGSLSNESSVSIAAGLNWDIEEGFSGPVDAEIIMFYMKKAGSVKSIADRCGSVPWPQYRPKTHRVAISGCPTTQHVQMSSSEGGTSLSESSTVGAFINTEPIPSCLHGNIHLDPEYHDTVSPNGATDAIVDAVMQMGKTRISMLRAAVADGKTVYGLDCSVATNAALVTTYIDLMDTQNKLSTDLKASDFPVQVRPANIGATNYTKIQKGRFLKESSIQLAKWGRVLVKAKVVIIK